MMPSMTDAHSMAKETKRRWNSLLAVGLTASPQDTDINEKDSAGLLGGMDTTTTICQARNVGLAIDDVLRPSG